MALASSIKSFLGIGKKDYEGKSLYRNALDIAWPATLEGMLLSIIGTVDTIMVKEAHKYAIAALNLTTQPRMILLIIAQALCTGTSVLVARRKGEGRQDQANSVLQQSMVVITGIGILISLLGSIFAGPIMTVAGADADTYELATSYFRIIAAGLIFNCWSLCICASQRAIGNTRITMITNITANLVNVCFNYCLIGGHFGFPALGVRGAAIATVIGNAVACVIAFIYAMRPNGYLQFHFRIPKFDKVTLSGLTKVGSSSMAESVFLRLGFFITTRMVAGMGANALTAYSVVQQVTSFSFCMGDGIATAGSTLIGQSLGAKRKDTARDYIRTTRVISVVASILLMIAIYFTREQIPLLFTDEAKIIAGASIAFIVVICGIITHNGRVVYSGCLRGAGDVRFVAIVSLVSVAIVRPICTYICCYPLNDVFPQWELWAAGPWIAFVIDAAVREIMCFVRIRKGKFLDIEL